ncbi:spore germination protein [Lottiidibacillus patelloidae]|uniref:Spore germination protein n=1 Tax=Lottiidibacillus patelloidae TaxID=2670334 RepID=A0A263BYD2_9BACI|nr:spore germination protein [Lottiidibacillus patelloidae]OZM58317.1 spore germination protein [Lottiidibacillus patelloidae]
MKKLIKTFFEKKLDKYLDEKKVEESLIIEKSLKNNMQHLQKFIGSSDDITVRKIIIANDINVTLIYTDGLVDSQRVREIFDTLLIKTKEANIEVKKHEKNITSFIQEQVLTNDEIQIVQSFSDILNAVLSGDTAILIDGNDQALLVETKGWEKRAVSEPLSQTVVRGPQEAFTETLRTNTALIRRKIKDTSLKIEQKKIGRLTKTDVAIAYIDGIVDESVVQEVKDRLSKIDVDAILDSNYIEEYIQDETYTPFPTIFNSERPDTISAGLLEGRVAIIVDGSPFVLLVPTIFTQFFQAAEDYYQRWDIASLLRLLRFLAFFITLFAPSLYIAVITFHQEMLPTTLLISLQSQREGIPFPAFIEAIIMEITFEILREAGIRMPRAVGSAISIVGALVIGEAAVQAGLISPSMVIVVSITAISSFIFPAYNIAISVRILRFPMMALAASFGLIGIIMGTIFLVLHLCSIRSFGVPYMAPVGPSIKEDKKDTLIRFPLRGLFSRPSVIANKNKIREDVLRQPEKK